MSKTISTTLENICLQQKGSIISGPFGSNISSKYFVPKGVPVIRGNNLSLSYDKFYDNGFVFVTKEKADELKCYAYRGDLVFTAAGTIGQVGIIPPTSLFDEYVISNKQIRARIDTNKVDLLYAYYWFSSPWIQLILQRSNKGSTVPLLTLNEVKQLPIIYPESLSEQRKIANCIEAISKKIEVNTKINDNLQHQLKLLYDYWFTQFDFPDDNGKPYRSSGGKMVWNDKIHHNIPASWKVSSLGEICSFKNGINYEKDEIGNKEYRIVNVRNITASQMLLDPHSFDSITLSNQKADKYLISANDFLIARSGSPGATRLLIPSDTPTIYCGFIICCSTSCEFRNYIALTLKKLETANDTKSSGSILKNVSQDTLKEIMVCVPQSNILESFNSKANTIIRAMQEIINENNTLTVLRDWLLPMLMNGQATISD